MFIESLLFSANVILPIILMLCLGIWLRKRQIVDDGFCATGSKLMFNITLPAMLFIYIIKNPVDYQSQIWLVGAGLLGTLVVYFVGEGLAARYIADRAYRGIFVQGIFRGNSGILGLALCINAYGSAATAPASVYTACLTLLFNLLAVLTLTHSLSDKKFSWKSVLKSLSKNPLILSIIAGLLISKFAITLPTALIRTGDYLAQITLPLALICTGASLDFKQLKRFEQQGQTRQIVLCSAFGRLVICPLVMVIIGRLLQLEPMSLGILFLMSSTPVAVASYAMVRHFGGDATAAANLIGITTLGSIFSASLGLLILRTLGWV